MVHDSPPSIKVKSTSMTDLEIPIDVGYAESSQENPIFLNLFAPTAPVTERPSKINESPKLVARKKQLALDEGSVAQEAFEKKESLPIFTQAGTELDETLNSAAKMLQEKDILDNISRLMRKGMDITRHYSISLTREEFAALTSEELKNFYDSQQQYSEKITAIFEQGCKLCKKNFQGYFQSLSETTHAFFAEKGTILTKKQHSDLDDLASLQYGAGIILLVDDSILILKLILKILSSILNLSSHKVMANRSHHLKNLRDTEWQAMGCVTETMANWVVICASNGAVAHEIIRVAKVSMMVTDFEMPKMNGVELIKSIRSQQTSSSMPIVLHTTLSKEQLLENDPSFDLVKQNVTYFQKNQGMQALKTFFKDNLPLYEISEHLNTGLAGCLQSPG